MNEDVLRHALTMSPSRIALVAATLDFPRSTPSVSYTLMPSFSSFLRIDRKLAHLAEIIATMVSTTDNACFLVGCAIVFRKGLNSFWFRI